MNQRVFSRLRREPAVQTGGLHPDDRGGERQQPDGHARTQSASGELDRRGTKAESGTLRRDPEKDADEKPRES